MPTPVGTAPLTVDNRARCSTCSRLQFSTVCSRKQCSKCCRDNSQRCGYTGHDSYKAHLLHAAAAPPAIAKDSFALSRPPPVHPPALPFADTSNILPPPASASPASAPPAPESTELSEATYARRSFRRPMDDTLKADWDQARSLRDEKLRGIAMQRESKWKKDNSLTLWCWLKDGEPPVREHIQGIHTFPFYSLKQAPAVLERLGVPEGGRIEAYLVRYRSWQKQDTDEVLSVAPQQTLLFRCVGVTDCLHIDEHIATAVGKATTGPPPLGEPQAVQVTIVAPKPLRTPKRKRVDDLTSPSTDRPTNIPRLDASLHSPSPVVPSLDCRSPCLPATPTSLYTALLAVQDLGPAGGLGLAASSSSLPPPPPFLVAPSPASSSISPAGPSSLASTPPPMPLAASIPDHLDKLWQCDQVHVPGSAGGLPWPHGMYVRDMAKGFESLASVSKNDVATMFTKVFAGAKWVPATFYSQRAAWYRSTEAERLRASSLPRAESGLWTTVRTGLSGWPLRRGQQARKGL